MVSGLLFLERVSLLTLVILPSMVSRFSPQKAKLPQDHLHSMEISFLMVSCLLEVVEILRIYFSFEHHHLRLCNP